MRKTPLVAAATALAIAAFSPATRGATASVNLSNKHQTIEGFGFFGAHDVWWGPSENMVNEAWADLVINDLGITMWRNEYYPLSDALNGQDADWAKQRPVVEVFKRAADAAGAPLKFILTVWTPPASMKCEVGDDGIHEGVPHPAGTKGGGALCPSQRDAFADWLSDGLDLYDQVGVDVYALSFQNEPFFWQSYNSCFYAQDWYANTLAQIGPRIRTRHPDVKLFGAENMLEIECGRTEAGEFDPWWYTGALLNNSAALDQLDAFAVHGYSDGVLATSTSKMSRLWSEYRRGVSGTGKPIWMTETSGYVDSWEAGPNGDGQTLPGALDLAQAIFAALEYGDLSAWVWWQGSSPGAANEFQLMQSTTGLGKRYYVSKQFYRYIRPGAQRVEVTGDDPEVLLTAFQHTGMNTFAVVAINGSTQEKTLDLSGTDLPTSFEAFRTSATEDAAAIGSVGLTAIALPARSVTTLVSGDVYEGTNPGAGSGGAAGAGGTSGSGGAGEAGGPASSGGASAAGGAPSLGGSFGVAGAGAVGTGATPSGTGAAPGTGATTGSGALAGMGASAPASSDESADDEGCGCAVPVSPPSSWGAGLLLVLGLFTARRRRARGGVPVGRR